MSIALQQMQETNRKLRRLLELVPQQESGPLRIAATDLTSLLTELRKVEQFRMSGANTCDGPLAAEVEEYRQNLEGLRDVLPRLQARYVAERARLEHNRAHLQAATGWAQNQGSLHRR